MGNLTLLIDTSDKRLSLPESENQHGVSFYDNENGDKVFFLGIFRTESLGEQYSTSSEDFYRYVIGEKNSDSIVVEGSYAAIFISAKNALVKIYSDQLDSRPVYFYREYRFLAISTDVLWLTNREKGAQTAELRGLNETAHYGFSFPGKSMYRGIERALPNSVTCLDIEKGGIFHQEKASIFTYKKVSEDSKERLLKEVDEALSLDFLRLKNTFSRAAILLSGGIDSSILARYAKYTFEKTVAYTCEIEGYRNPELERAKHVASSLGLEHRVVLLKKKDIPRLFEKLCRLMGEPTRHINNLVVLYLFEKVENVDVIIGGDGADGLFGHGYQKAIKTFSNRSALTKIVPEEIKLQIGRNLKKASNGKVRELSKVFTDTTLQYAREKYSVDFQKNEEDFLKRNNLGIGDISFSDLISGKDPVWMSSEVNARYFLSVMLQRNSKLSSERGVPMHYPFLSREIIEVSRKVPTYLRFDKTGNTKKTLIELCRRVVGDEVADWPKIGFTTPEREWLSEDLALYAEETLNCNLNKLNDYGLKFDDKDYQLISSSTRLLWWLISLNQVLNLASERARG